MKTAYKGIVIRLCCCILTAAGPWTTPCSGETGFDGVSGACGPVFPEDHGPHMGFRTEWWYYTGNLSGPRGEAFGFQLTFFRYRLGPPGALEKSASKWRTDQIFMAHAAISGVDKERHRYRGITARAMPGMAGAVLQGGETTVFLKNWRVRIDRKRHLLHVQTPDFSFDLTMVPEKPPVLHGEMGFTRRGDLPGQASCYYSFTRLAATGTLSIGESNYPVRGLGWMDHEYASEPLDHTRAGWDWFSLQLSDGTELMIYLIRMNDAGFSPVSSGTLVFRNGGKQHLSSKDFEITPTGTWRSERSGAVYPSGWRVTIPESAISLVVRPTFADQEMNGEAADRFTYWEGSVLVSGTAGGRKLSGKGYVELTGYVPGAGPPM